MTRPAPSRSANANRKRSSQSNLKRRDCKKAIRDSLPSLIEKLGEPKRFDRLVERTERQGDRDIALARLAESGRELHALATQSHEQYAAVR